MTLYHDLIAAGEYVSSHESDLYCEVNDFTKDLLHKYKVGSFTTFRNQVTGIRCFEIPFAYDPWWEARAPIQQSNFKDN